MSCCRIKNIRWYNNIYIKWKKQGYIYMGHQCFNSKLQKDNCFGRSLHVWNSGCPLPAAITHIHVVAPNIIPIGQFYTFYWNDSILCFQYLHRKTLPRLFVISLSLIYSVLLSGNDIDILQWTYQFTHVRLTLQWDSHLLQSGRKFKIICP